MRKTRAARFQDAREAVARKIITMKKEQLEKKTRLTEAKALLEARVQNRATGTTCWAVLEAPACSQSLDEKQEEKQSSKVHKAFKEVDVQMEKLQGEESKRHKETQELIDWLRNPETNQERGKIKWD